MTGKTVTPALDRLDGSKKLEFERKDFKEPLPAAAPIRSRTGHGWYRTMPSPTTAEYY